MSILRSIPFSWALAGSSLLALFYALGAIGDLSGHSFLAILALLACSSVYLIVCWRILTRTGYQNKGWILVFFAVCFRLALVWCPPSLSGDLYRYRWEGRARAAGANPYLVTPDQPSMRALRDETYPQVSSPSRKAGYGPLWIEVEHFTARLAATITPDARTQTLLCKGPSILADLLSLWLLAMLLRQRGLPFERWVIYAWCPLPVVEFWHEGHNDSWVVAALLGALLLAGKGRWTAAFAALTTGTLVKLWPAMLFPLFVFSPAPGASRPRWWQWAVSLPLSAPFVWLFWAPVGENIDFMSGFLGGWRNNDSLFALVLWLAGPLHAKYAVALALLAALAVLLWRRVELARSCLMLVVVLLLVSANVHPWYLSWFAPLLALFPSAPLFLWLGLMPISYAVLAQFHAEGVWQGSTSRRWWIYAPVFLFYAMEQWKRRRIR